MKTKDFLVITRMRDLISYILTITEKSPKKFRFTLVSRLQNLSLNSLEFLLRANEVRWLEKESIDGRAMRVQWQKRAVIEIKLLSYVSMIAYEHQCITNSQYEEMSRRTSEVLSLTYAWIKKERQ